MSQINGKTETLADGTTNTYAYHYDDKRRLITVVKNGTTIESYEYDANGNRKLQTVAARSITALAATYNLGDQLETNGNTRFEYDTNGRLSKKFVEVITTDAEGAEVSTETRMETKVELYSYSSLGRLLSATIDGKTITYKHNAIGNRVAKLVDGIIVEKYLWLNKTTLAAIYDKDALQNSEESLVQRFEYGIGNSPASFTQDGNKYYITSDHLGSPRTISDDSGNVLKAIEYDSFGNVISDTNPALKIPFGFAGGLDDKDTKLLRFGYRDFDPETGRWTARDPIGFAGGDTNLYGYVASDSVNWIDADGLMRHHIQKNIAKSLARLAGKICAGKGGGGATPKSPKINPKDVANKTPEQIDKLSTDKGLVPKGPDPKSGKGSYTDPITGEQRVLCHTNCSNPHGHVNDSSGRRLDINGNVVPAESAAAHLPIKQ